MTLPFEKGDHPELDATEFLDAEGVSGHLSSVGQIQQSNHTNIPVMTMSSFVHSSCWPSHKSPTCNWISQ